MAGMAQCFGCQYKQYNRNSNNEAVPKRTQPYEGSDQDLNLTNSDASLLKMGDHKQPDATSMNDGAASVDSEKLTQTAMGDGGVNPEFGNAAEPTFEAI